MVHRHRNSAGEPRPRRQQIIDSARRICLLEGLVALTMRRVADDIGISATAIYRHFSDKDALVHEVIDEANSDLARYLRRGLRASSPWTRFEATLKALLEFGLHEPHSWEILFLTKGRTDMDSLPQQVRSPNFIYWIDRIRECIDSGVMRESLDPTDTAITIWAQAHGLMALHLQGRFGNDEAVFRSVWSRSMTHLFDGLRS